MRQYLTWQTEPGFPAEWEGLDYASADDATPRLYGVSFGNGNDGVSHMFADYYVKTCDPWLLTRAATLGSFKPEFQPAANEAVEIDGEADYTIYATIYNPEDVDPAEAPSPTYTLSYVCPEYGETWENESADDANELDDCAQCNARGIEPDESSENEIDGDDTYSAANGAWFICEVFREDEPRDGRPIYDSLEDCFGDNAPELTMAHASEEA